MKRVEFETKFDSGEEGTFEGYASVFGNIDNHNDIMAPGAFTESLKSRTPVLLFSHKTDQPIGKFDKIYEDGNGLRVKGRLSTVGKGAEAYDLLKMGAIRGLSVGFKTQEQTRDQKSGVRTITKAELFEISLVSIPANERASVDSVKQAAMGAANDKEGTMPDDIKTGSDAAPEAKAVTVEDVKGLQDQIAGLEAKLNRPSVPAQAKDSDIEMKQFETFLRTGAGPTIEQKDLALTGAGNTASFLVPEQFINEIAKDIIEYSPVRQAARVGTMSGSLAKLPRRTEEVSAVWVGETEARTPTQPAYGEISFEPYEIAAYVDVSNQALEDSAFNIEAELRADLAEEFGQIEGAAFVNGTGTGQPTGFTTDTNAGEVDAVDAATAGGFDTDDLFNLFYSLKTPYAQRGVWMMNRATVNHVRKLTNSVGQNLFMPQGFAGAPSNTILGRPVIEVPDLPDIPTSTGAASPVWFGDFNRFYRIMDRVQMEIMRDPYTRATNGSTRFHARRRVAGKPVISEAATKLTVTVA